MRKLLSVSAETFRKWLAGGVLPDPVLIDGVWRWRLAEVRAWIAKLPRRDGRAA